MYKKTLMLRLAAVAVFSITATVSISAQALAKGFSLGVTAGEVTDTSAMLWTRSNKPAKLTLQLAAGLSDGQFADQKTVKTSRRNDNTVTVKITGLLPSTSYRYRFIGADKKAKSAGVRSSEVGKFKTAPAVDADQAIRFGISGDTDAARGPKDKKPHYNNFEIYKLMSDEKNDFNINLGDTIYSDSEILGPQEKASSSSTHTETEVG